MKTTMFKNERNVNTCTWKYLIDKSNSVQEKASTLTKIV